MNVTIGEVINEIMPYSNALDLKMVGGIPYVRASLSNGSDINSGYLYVVQTSEHQYSVADTYDELTDGIFIPMKNVSGYLISEKEFARTWSGLDMTGNRNPIINLSYSEFIKYFYSMLANHKITYATGKNLNSTIGSLKFITPKVHRTLEELCRNNGYPSLLVIDIISIIKACPNKCRLRGLHAKHLKEILSKFKHIGISLKIDKDMITEVKIEKRSIRGKVTYGK